MAIPKVNWDKIGISASVACAIHCALLPILLTSLPLVGLEFLRRPLFEYGMISAAMIIGSYSLLHGLKKHHHKWQPFAVFCCGMCFIFLKEIWTGYELWFLFPGVALIIAGHLMNLRSCRLHGHAHKEDCAH